MHSFEKKSRLHIALCALSLLAACASDPIGEEAPQPVGEPSRETAATGRLRVKFKQGEVPERIIETRRRAASRRARAVPDWIAGTTSGSIRCVP